MSAYKNLDKIGFLFVGFTIITLDSIIYIMTNSGLIGWGDFAIGTATLFLAFATFFLAFIGIDESKKDRRRLRIKEKLEGLYSPLMANIKSFQDYDEKKINTSVHNFMLGLKNKYIYLAEPDLRKILFTYYNTSKFDVNQRNFLNQIADTIERDYKKLIKEYDELTD
jgi:hypothetical protein